MGTHNMEQALAMGNRLIMMHQGRIIMDIEGEEKKATQVKDLMGAFENIRGAELSDRTLLG